MTKLNTKNPQALSFTSNQIEITVLGGIQFSSLERLKVTLRIKSGNNTDSTGSPQAIRQPLDLYNGDLIGKLVRKAAERFELPTSDIYKAISELTESLEEYRLEQIEKKQDKKPEVKELTNAEKKAALSFLKKENLMEATSVAIGKSGVIGEELNRLLIFIAYTSRKRAKPLHIICLGSSGSGKTYLQAGVASLIPDEDIIEITALSENALYYFGEKELAGKLILIEDLDGAEEVLYPLRELQSKQKISKTVPFKDPQGNIQTQSITVKGPVATSGCTTKEKFYEDNANRAFLIHLDKSQRQDEQILNYQRSLSAGNVCEEEQNKIRTLLQNCQRMLNPVSIRNPYADKLNIPHLVFKQRRTNELYLKLIEAISFYHQKQREEMTDKKTGEIYIQTNLDDIAWANRLICEALISKSDELAKAERNFFEALKKYLQKNESLSFYTKDLRSFLRCSPATVSRHVFNLEQYGYLEKVRGSKAKGFEYKLTSLDDYKLLKEHVFKVLDKVLNQLKEAS